MKMKLFSLLVLLSFFTFSTKAQECWQKPTGDKKIAKDYFAYGMYPCALKEYLIIYAKKPKNKKINERIADCYLLSAGAEKNKAIKYLLFLSKQKKVDDIVFFKLGQAYMYNGEYKKALEYYTKYEGLASLNNTETENLNKFKEFAKFSMEMTKHPVNVTFENLGEDVNSEYNELHPYVTDKEDFIIMTTDRKGTRGGIENGDGYFRDIYIAKHRKRRTGYKGARGMPGTFNTEFTEEVSGGSPNGEYFVYTSDEKFNTYNLNMSYKEARKRSYPKAEPLEGINGRNSNEVSATLTNDGSLIIFSSDRKGGSGGFDLWMSKKLPNGSWGTPINLGPEINTSFDEIYPMFTQNQDAITFSSNGKKGMGGFDLFKTSFSEELKTWTAPKNLGYPVNTAYDDFSIVFVKNGRYAYKSAIRGDTRGMRDIYRLTFNDAMPAYTVVKSQLLVDSTVNIDSKIKTLEEKSKRINLHIDSLSALDQDSIIQLTIDSLEKLKKNYFDKIDKLDPYANAFVEVKSKTGELIGQYTPNRRNGKFILILEPGVYDLTITKDGYETLTNRFRIFDKVNFTPELKRDYYIKPKASNL